MPFALLIIGVQMPGGLNRSVESGRYVAAFDPGAHDGRTAFPTSDSIADAMHFATRDAALAFYQTQSRVVPYRTDGCPNRPMTSFTVQLVRVAPAPDRARIRLRTGRP